MNEVNLSTLTAEEATERLRAWGMRISPDMVRKGIEQGAFPFGVVVRSGADNPRCFVFHKLLYRWAEQVGYTTREGKSND